MLIAGKLKPFSVSIHQKNHTRQKLPSKLEQLVERESQNIAQSDTNKNLTMKKLPSILGHRY